VLRVEREVADIVAGRVMEDEIGVELDERLLVGEDRGRDIDRARLQINKPLPRASG